MKKTFFCCVCAALTILAAATFSTQAAEPVRWNPTKFDIVHKKYDVHLPRFSPDSRLLAYAVTVPSDDIAFVEIRRYSFAERKTRVLFPLAESRKMAVYGAYPMAIRWTGPNALTADVSNGDDGYNVYALKADRTGSLSYKSFDAADEAVAPLRDPVLRGLTPDWPEPVFENALQYMVRIRAHGALMQKHYARQDDHLWWLDLGDRTARIARAEPNGAKQELMSGFAFGDYAVFALRSGDTVMVQCLDGDGHLQEVEGSRVETDIGPDAINSNVGAVDNRRCSETACWAAYRVRRGNEMQARIVRLERSGRATLLEPIEGLEDFDVSPDFKRLVAAVMRDGKRMIRIFDITEF
jgi:hypothetical protein